MRIISAMAAGSPWTVFPSAPFPPFPPIDTYVEIVKLEIFP